ncbi:LacI family DNA-binding transcriptional regulator [Paenibacillus sp.]|uniref:LacI family DNA-binding transcriptional regulator n=1 Tax=Paenibacillus sp. TaxID=58172 RepID=UPI002D55926E|nr:LacI family DNA-binding transcriptional regulator [Paenibacillus sp.]HZG85035.1 LacI family DNA-binding transcriptional regulator [Paenibacillus sp.]
MQQRTTIKDVARVANVSIATVSNVLNGTGRVAPETMKRVQKVIEELQFSPSTSARNLKDKKSQLIAVVVPFLEKGRLQDNPFYWQLVSGIEEGARNHALQVILIGVDEQETFSFVHERHLDGLIVVGVFEGSSALEKIRSLQIPTVYMDSYLSDPSLVQVYLDDELGGYIGTKHLIALGHRRIAVLTGKLIEGGVTFKRWQGYRRALEEAGIPYLEELVIEEPTSPLGGYHSAQIVGDASKRISAVFAFSDVAAMGLIKGLHEIGLTVPNDVSVMGYDDIFYCDYMIPALTTVRQDIVQKGQTAVNLLLRLQEEGVDANEVDRRVVLPVNLKVRQSTAPWRG